MKLSKKITLFITVFVSLFFAMSKSALAICPVCTLAVGAGLGLSRWVGVDDTVSGIWVGAFLLSSSMWFYNWLSAKYKKFKSKYYLALLIILTFLVVFIPLAKADIIGHPFNTILGIDKLVFGSALGAGVFTLSIFADKKVRQIRGKQLFQYQKVAFPVSLLILASTIMFFVAK